MIDVLHPSVSVQALYTRTKWVILLMDRKNQRLEIAKIFQFGKLLHVLEME